MRKTISRAKQAALGGLSALWGVAVTSGFLLRRPEAPGKPRLPEWLALGSSGLLSVIGWGWRQALHRGPAADYATDMAAGMTLGAVGDVCMRTSVPQGMAAFALGHVAYVRGMLRLQRQQGLRSRAALYGAWGFWLGAAVAGWYVVVARSPKGLTPLGWAGLGYSLLLASTCGVAWGTALQDRRYLGLALGGTLFLASDTIIAMRLFNPDLFAALPEALRGDLVWLTYAPAQALLVHSIPKAAAVFAASAPAE
jgi:hypothetical protein